MPFEALRGSNHLPTLVVALGRKPKEVFKGLKGTKIGAFEHS